MDSKNYHLNFQVHWTIKAELVEKILDSFNFPKRQEIDTLWAKEAEDRINAYNQGKIESIPASSVFEKIEKLKLK